MLEVNRGVMIADGAMSPAAAETCLTAARGIYSAIEARRAGPPASVAERKLRQSIDLWGGMQLSDIVPFCRDNRIPGAASIVAGASWLAGDGTVAWDHSFVRRLTPDKPVGVPWHCDAEAASTMLLPDWERYVSLWAPLVPVGVEGSPTLEVAVGSNVIMREETLIPAEHREAAWVDQIAVGNVLRVCPKLQPGDVIAFDQLTLHRTQQARVDCERITMEVRFIP